MPGERGPLPKKETRRRNKKPESGIRVEVAAPSMPRDLTPEARAEWRRVVPVLKRMGVLATLDRTILIRHCQLWADWVDITAQIAASGRLVRGRMDGTVVRNPLWLMRNDVANALSDIDKQLGLSPMARLRAGVMHEFDEPEAPDEEITAINDYRARLAK